MTEQEIEAKKQAKRDYEKKLYSENQTSHEKRLASKKAYRERKKNDPAYIEIKKAERQRYYEKVKSDPERYAKRLEYARLQKQRAAERKLEAALGITPSTGTESQA